MNKEILLPLVAAALHGLCAANEVSIRKPESIAKKAVEIAKEATKLLEDID